MTWGQGLTENLVSPPCSYCKEPDPARNSPAPQREEAGPCSLSPVQPEFA